MFQKGLAICILLFGAVSPAPAFAANWFDGIKQECASNLSAAFVGSGPLNQLVAPTDRTSFTSSGSATRLTYRLLSTDLPNPKTHYRTTVLTLNQQAKADLELALTRAAGNDPLLLVEGAAGVVLSIAPDVVGYTWTLIWEAAKAVFNVKPLSVEAVIPLLAIGGEVTRDTVIQRKSNKQLWADVFWYYRVKVGNESRSVLLASCRMAVEAAPTVILTKDDRGNKRLTLKQDVWEVYDLEDNKYDAPLKPADQDPEWLYANEGSNQHRFSNSGAGWQTMSGGRWRFLYRNISFE